MSTLPSLICAFLGIAPVFFSHPAFARFGAEDDMGFYSTQMYAYRVSGDGSSTYKASKSDENFWLLCLEKERGRNVFLVHPNEKHCGVGYTSITLAKKRDVIQEFPVNVAREISQKSPIYSSIWPTLALFRYSIWELFANDHRYALSADTSTKDKPAFRSVYMAPDAGAGRTDKNLQKAVDNALYFNSAFDLSMVWSVKDTMEFAQLDSAKMTDWKLNTLTSNGFTRFVACGNSKSPRKRLFVFSEELLKQNKGRTTQMKWAGCFPVVLTTSLDQKSHIKDLYEEQRMFSIFPQKKVAIDTRTNPDYTSNYILQERGPDMDPLVFAKSDVQQPGTELDMDGDAIWIK